MKEKMKLKTRVKTKVKGIKIDKKNIIKDETKDWRENKYKSIK